MSESPTSHSAAPDSAAAKVQVPAIVRADEEKPQAIIYLPNLKQDPEAETIATVAHRIALAMDNISDQRGAEFTAVTAADAAYDGVTTRTAIIRRKDAAGKQVDVIHLYEFDYRPTLLGGFQKRQPVVQAAQIALTLAGNAAGFVKAIFKRSQSIPQKLQVLYAGLLAAGMLLYMLMLLATAAATARNVVSGGPPPAVAQAQKGATPAAGARPDATAQPPAAGGVRRIGRVPNVEMPAWPVAARAVQPRTAPGMGPAPVAREKAPSSPVPLLWQVQSGARWTGKWVWKWTAYAAGVVWFVLTWPFLGAWSLFLRALNASASTLFWMQSAVIGFSVLGLTVRVSLKDVLSRMSMTTTCASSYLAYGIGRNELVGHLARLLDHVGSREVEYRNVHLVGYSFGSVVALDSVFQDSEVSATFGQITTLSTIGCPADFIRTYWRDYFVDRHPAPGKPLWVNVYAPRDVLASNFARGTLLGIGAAEREATQANTVKGYGIALCETQPASSRRWSIKRAVTALRKVASEDLGITALKLEPGDASRDSGEATDEDALNRFPDRHIKFGDAAPASWVGWIFFIVAAHGFRAHERYWTRGINTAKTCWEPLLKVICAHQPPTDGAAATEKAPAGSATSATPAKAKPAGDTAAESPAAPVEEPAGAAVG